MKCGLGHQCSFLTTRLQPSKYDPLELLPTRKKALLRVPNDGKDHGKDQSNQSLPNILLRYSPHSIAPRNIRLLHNLQRSEILVIAKPQVAPPWPNLSFNHLFKHIMRDMKNAHSHIEIRYPVNPLRHSLKQRTDLLHTY